tara:strand:- start:7236 stop:8105 length:870 start_codon:yes stop_codon:yes gene_type:complete
MMQKFFKSFLLLLLAACSTTRSAKNLNEKPQVVSEDQAYELALKPQKGDRMRHRYHVVSITRTFDGSSVAREKEEITDFVVEQLVKRVNDKTALYVITVPEKNGVMDLHDLVMPRIGETLRLHLAPNGKVYYAEGYETHSPFYLSPISLPDKKVKVGDTWVLKEEWKNDKSGMPMQIDLVSILKNIYISGGRKYAEIETSGEVSVPLLGRQKVDFSSNVVGRLLIELQSGNVVWSEIRNYETLEYPEAKVNVRTCMEMVIEKPEKLVWPWALKPNCDPAEEFVYSIPGN